MNRFTAVAWLLLMMLVSSAEAASCKAPHNRVDAVALDTNRVCLHGTLTLPDGRLPYPLVIIVPGSGPTDRDGNQPGWRNDAYEQLANALRKDGIATFRCDKRGVGESASAVTTEQDLRFEDYVDDVAAWMKQFGYDPRFSHQFLLGHSEGSLIAMLAASKRPVAGVISVAGSGRPIVELLREQLHNRFGEEKAQLGLRILDRIAAGETVSDVPEEWIPYFRPSVQPYLISLSKYDPARIIASLHVSVLVLQGGHDIQVAMRDGELLARANPQATLQFIGTMNHVMKTVPSDPRLNMRAYETADFPLAPELVTSVRQFVRKIAPDSHAPRSADSPHYR